MAADTAGSLINWNDRYSVGITRIDAEHQKLALLINELYGAMLADDVAAGAARIADGLALYTFAHFAAEEGLLRRHNFPGYAEHKIEHDKLLAQVKQLQQDLHAGKTTISQVSFLQTWLIGHILGMDKRYTSHLHAAGIR